MMFLIELGSKSPHGEGKITFRPLVGEWRTNDSRLVSLTQPQLTLTTDIDNERCYYFRREAP